MYPVKINNFGIKMQEAGKHSYCFLIKKLFLGRDSHYVALIYVYIPCYGENTRTSGVDTYKKHFFTTTAAKM